MAPGCRSPQAVGRAVRERSQLNRFRVTATDGPARAGVLSTAHGDIPTPAFMPVGTKATVKSLHPDEVRELGAHVVLGNAYHLHFRPGEDVVEDHEIHGERYRVEPDAWRRIQRAEKVLAVGTTTTRVLETLARGAPLEGRAELFITPGFEFRRVDALLTNFHLPRTTLLALVMAFAGVDRTRELYEIAIRERYRFYSFGDAMLLL